MNHRHLQRNERLREQLTSEYVLGTLKGGARRRFEQWLAVDATLLHTVRQWQNRLSPMAEFAPNVQPPARVWQSIEQSLRLTAAPARARPPFRQRVFNDLAFWRGLGIGATALATLLIAVLMLRQPEIAPSPVYLAMLSGDSAQPVVVVTGDARQRTLTVHVVAQQNVAADKSLELWAVPSQGAPRSLGLVAGSGTVILRLPENITPQSAPLLAISLEPKGGSPNPNGPSGPILYKGAWVQI
ncbi:anti-sigma factor [Herbaspirillum sp. ST 5-3]|uniref:anti-sigma factor n=1 Tax=Oxalobacteraceae TaxID=75682 RepID=UPI001FFE36CE|nr:anti-sigma factor [Herbaspirillum sp. ST 5-3]